MLNPKTNEQRLLKYAKDRAKKQGITFDLSPEDITIPKVCPILGIPLFQGKGRPSSSSPSIDRIVPELGYVRGNVLVVSRRANLLKNDATIGELTAMATRYYTQVKRKFMR